MLWFNMQAFSAIQQADWTIDTSMQHISLKEVIRVVRLSLCSIVRVIDVVGHWAEMVVLGHRKLVTEMSSKVHWKHHSVSRFVHLIVLIIVNFIIRVTMFFFLLHFMIFLLLLHLLLVMR